MEESKARLAFRCVECGKAVELTDNDEIFNLVESQLVAETRDFYCQDCADD